MERKVLIAALATSLMVTPSFAMEKTGIPVIDRYNARHTPSIVYQNVKGTQKALCIMVNLKENPFNSKHDEKFYYNEFFGKSPYSVANYVKHESNGKFSVKPADTKGTKYPGVIKVDIDGSKYENRQYDISRIKSEFFRDVVDAVKDQVDWAKIDQNGDKELEQPTHDLGNPKLLRELQISMIVSGSVNRPEDEGIYKLKFWPTCSMHVGNFNGYYVSTLGMTSSEYVEGPAATSATFAHEFLHNLGAKDMYKDRESIGVWSIMCYHNVTNYEVGDYTPAQLDPMHKLHFGWSKPVKVTPKPDATVKVNRKEVPYIVGSDGIYILDYRDAEDKYKVNMLRGDRLLVWKVNKDVAISDWDGYEGIAPGGTEMYNSEVNSDGPGTAMKVINYSGTPVGDSISFGGVTVEVGDGVLNITR